MDFLIANSFTDSLARLTGDEQKVVTNTAFDLQLNPASPGMGFCLLGVERDNNFRSVRVMVNCVNRKLLNNFFSSIYDSA